MVSILVDDGLVMRSFEIEDAPELFRAVCHSRQHLRPWLLWVDATTKQEHSLQFIQRTLHQLHHQEGLVLGIFHNEEIVGEIGMHDWNHYLKKAQIGYWIAKEHEGKGILSTCLTRFVDFLFTKVGLNKIEIQFITQNKRSAKVAEKLGCKVEGILRDSCMLNGKLENLVVTGLLKGEWKPLPPAQKVDWKS